jgi:hypothetical protein
MINTLKYRRGGKDIVIHLTKSAPNQIKPFPGIRDLCLHWRSKGYDEVVDLGCGRLRNSLVLVSHFKLWICDFPQLLESPSVSRRLARLQGNRNFQGTVDPDEFRRGKLTADAAVIAYVLHTLPDLGMRVRMVRSAIENTKAPHELFISVPNGEYHYRQRMGAQNEFNDGYLFGTGGGARTFYREYTREQLDEFMARLGLKPERSFPAEKKVQRTFVKEKR